MHPDACAIFFPITLACLGVNLHSGGNSTSILLQPGGVITAYRRQGILPCHAMQIG